MALGWIKDNLIDPIVEGGKDLLDSAGDFFSDPLGALEDAFNFGMDVITFGTFSYVKDQIRGYIAGLIPEQDFEDRKRTVRSENQPRTAIYGRVRTGGQLVYVEDDGKDNIILWMCFVLAGHECEEIETVYANGEVVATSNGPGVNGTMVRPASSLGDNILCWSVHGNRYSAFIPSMNVTSSDSSYNGTFSPPNWTTQHRLTYQTYVWIALTFDKETFGDVGLPAFEFDVKGKNNIYDPRTGSNRYTDNQALVMLDVLRWDALFDEDLGNIDLTDFANAANIADQLVASGVGTTEKRYTVNGTFKMQTVPMDILQSVSAAGAAYPYFDLASGKWKVTPGVYEAPVMDFDESDIVGGISFQSGPSKNSRHNIATGTYIDPNQDFESVGFPELYITNYVNSDLEELRNTYKFPWTNSPTMARRLAKIDIERNRYGISCSVIFKFRAIKLAPGDRITLNIAEFGWSPKIFRVEEVEVSLQNGIAVSLREDSPDIYDWTEGEALALDVPPVLSIPQGLTMSSPSTINFGESLYEQVNGTKVIKLSLSWADQMSAYAYDIQYKLTTDVEWTTAGTYWQDTNIDIFGIASGNYDFRIRSISGVATKSTWTTVQYTVSGFLASQIDGLSLQSFVDTPPSPQANFTTIRATVTPPADVTFSHALIEYQIDGDSSWVVAGPTNSSNYRDIIVNTDGSTYNVRAFSVSTSGTIYPVPVSQQIAVLDKDNSGDIPSIAPLSAVTGLGIAGGGTSFTGKDAVINWTDPNSESVLVRSYRVVIKDTSFNAMRSAIVMSPEYTYTYEMNAADYEAFHSSPGTNRSFIVEVTVIGNLNTGTITHESNAAAVTVSNPAPGQPTSLAVSVGYQQVKLNLRKPADLDYVETKIYLGTATGFAVNDSSYVASAYDGSVTIGGLTSGESYFLRLQAYDPYGAGSLSSEIPFTTAVLESGGPWAGITVADKAFIDQYMANNALASTKIESIVAGKIATGYLAATASIGVGDPASKPYTVTLGENDWGLPYGVSLISVERNSNGEIMFGFFESGLLKLGSTAEIQSNGAFTFGDLDGVGNYLDYNVATGKLTLKGSLVITEASGYNNLTDKPTSLSDINTSESSKLGGIAAGADVTGDNTAAGIVNQGSLATKNAVTWETEVTGTGKPANNADVTNYADARVANAINADNVTTIARPGGASYSGPNNGTGYIKITLPVSWTNTMMYFSVDVFVYGTDKSFTLQLGGYNYATSATWINVSARLIGSVASNNTVRFGHDGSKCCIWIGESNSDWDYIKVRVRDFQAGYSNFAVDTWDDGWSIGLTTTAPPNVDATISDALLDARSILGQGALATKNTADYGTDISGTKPPADADKTSDNTAAGIANQGALATKDNVAYNEITGTKPPSNATVGADWATTLSGIPAEISGSASNGLNLTPTHMGYYNNGWKTYIKNDGTFFFGDFDSGQYLDYSGGVLQLGPKTSIGSNEDREITVGSGGDYSTINAALEALSRTVPTYKFGGFTATIQILAGTTISEQVIVDGIDLSWITITSVDTTVTFSSTAISNGTTVSGRKPAFAAIDGGRLPKIDIQPNLSASVTDSVFIMIQGAASSGVHVGGTIFSLISVNGFQTAYYALEAGILLVDGSVDIGGCTGSPLLSESFAGIYVNGRLDADNLSDAIYVTDDGRLYVEENLYCRYHTSYGFLSFRNGRTYVKGSFSAGGSSSVFGGGISASSGAFIGIQGDYVALYNRSYAALVANSGAQISVSGEANANYSNFRGFYASNGGRIEVISTLRAENCLSHGIYLTNGAQLVTTGNWCYCQNNTYDGARISNATMRVGSTFYGAGSGSGYYGIRVENGGIMSVGAIGNGNTNIAIDTFNTNGIIWT